MFDNKALNKRKPPSLKQVFGLRIGMAVGGIAILALLSPLIWAAVTAGVGLLFLGGIVAVGAAALQALPLVAQKWENKILEERKKEARRRPIETMQLYLKSRSADVANFRLAVIAMATQVKNMASMVEDRKKNKPEWDSSKKDKAILQMTSAVSVYTGKYQAAEQALVQLKDVIEENEFDWKFSNAVGDARSAMNDYSGEELVEKMLANEAFDAVRDNFNSVFAELDLEATQLTSKKSLEFDDGMTIDLSSIRLGQTTNVRIDQPVNIGA